LVRRVVLEQEVGISFAWYPGRVARWVPLSAVLSQMAVVVIASSAVWVAPFYPC